LGPASEEIHGLSQRPHSVNADAADGRRLRGVGLWKDQTWQSFAPGAFRHRERAANTAQPSVEGQLADNADPFQDFQGYGPGRGEHGEGNRQVEGRSFFTKVRRREVDYHLLRRELVAAVRDRNTHSLTRLLDRGIRQPDDGEARKARAHVYLDLDRQSIYT